MVGLFCGLKVENGELLVVGVLQEVKHRAEKVEMVDIYEGWVNCSVGFWFYQVVDAVEGGKADLVASFVRKSHIVREEVFQRFLDHLMSLRSF